MKFTLIFISPNGTSKTTSDELSKILIKKNHTVNIINLALPEFRVNYNLIFKILDESDIVGFGSPAYHMNVLKPITKLLEKINNTDKRFNFKAFLYLNYGGITTGKAFINPAKLLEKSNIPIIGAFKVVAPHFHHAEIFPNKIALQTINNFYNSIEKKKFKTMPSSTIKKKFSPKNKLINLLYPLIPIIGKRRELPIDINNEKCVQCKKCINECPVGAISLDKYISIDYNLCMHCYHCVITCPVKAIKSPLEKLDKMISLNKKIVGCERPQNEIII